MLQVQPYKEKREEEEKKKKKSPWALNQGDRAGAKHFNP